MLRDGLYYGLAFYGNDLYASRGAQDRITRFTLTGEGKLVSAGSDLSVPKPTGQKISNHPAGLAFGVVSRMPFAPPSSGWPPVC